MNRKVTGIGCYAKPAKLSRVFKKMVRNYTLGQFESINLANSQDMAGGVDGTIMLKALISGNAGYFPAPDSESCSVAENRKITGFFNIQESGSEFVDLCPGGPQHPANIHDPLGWIY